MKNLAVFVSGTSTLLKAMINDELRIVLVLADRHCPGYDQMAPNHGIPRELIERKDFSKSFDREAYTERVLEALERHQIELVAMAGFMTVLSPVFFQKYKGVILNSHPSLLPKFKGAHAVRDALAAGVQMTGTTIHVATAELDDERQIIDQREVQVLPGDTEETLHERIKKVERKLYPEVLRRLLENEK